MKRPQILIDLVLLENVLVVPDDLGYRLLGVLALIIVYIACLSLRHPANHILDCLIVDQLACDMPEHLDEARSLLPTFILGLGEDQLLATFGNFVAAV